jgi:hypothetical protein
MPKKFRYMLGVIVSVGVIATSLHVAAQSAFVLKVEDVMTPQELKDTGLSGATAAQRKAFDAWLTRYTQDVFKIATTQSSNGAISNPHPVSGDCSPAIESTLAGDFNGWEGETIFKLDNGQIWEQAEYSYSYSYSYRPDVTIYHVSGGCRLKVEDEDETILVRRIK